MSIRFAAAILAALPCLPLVAQEHPAKPATPAAPAGQDKGKQDKPAFVVVQVGTEYQVMAKDEADKKKQQMAEQHKQAVAAYDKEKAAAEAAHKKFDKQAPKETAVTVQAGEYPTKEAAEAARTKLMADKKGGDHPAGGDAKKEPPKAPPGKGKH